MTRALYYDPIDGRPETVLAPFDWVSPEGIMGGLGVMFGVPLICSLLLLFAVTGEVVAGAVLPDEAEEEIPAILEEEDIIEARFVQLGRDFERELPNRQVPRLSTAPPEPAAVPTEETPVQRAEERERPREPPPPDAVEDLLQRIGDRAQAFAEIAEEREREGDPEGLEEGTETEATAGDIYRGRLYSFFRRGWSIPTTLSREEASGLTAIVNVQIGQDLELVSFGLRRSSGNAVFDQSIIEHLTRLQASDQHVPPPPEEVADQYIGQSIAVRFHGRSAS